MINIYIFSGSSDVNNYVKSTVKVKDDCFWTLIVDSERLRCLCDGEEIIQLHFEEGVCRETWIPRTSKVSLDGVSLWRFAGLLLGSY